MLQTFLSATPLWMRRTLFGCAMAMAMMTMLRCDGLMTPVHAQTAYNVSVHSTDSEVKMLPMVEVFYSPAQDLETIDLAELSKATKSVDISTYAMDDKPIAEELVKLAQSGVHIRIYRDKTQYGGEEARGKKGREDLNRLFAGQKNIQIRVKGVDALAHLKAYVVDGWVLREGSANWSASGEKVQDNSLLLIRDPVSVALFEQNFEAIWNRSSNQDVQ